MKKKYTIKFLMKIVFNRQFFWQVYYGRKASKNNPNYKIDIKKTNPRVKDWDYLNYL